MHVGKGVPLKQTKQGDTNSSPDENKSQSHSALGELDKAQSNIKGKSDSSLSSLIQKQQGSATHLFKPVSGSGLSLSSLAQTHLASSPQSSSTGLFSLGKPLGSGLGGLSQPSRTAGTVVNVSQSSSGGVSLSSLASQHLGTGSSQKAAGPSLGLETTSSLSSLSLLRGGLSKLSQATQPGLALQSTSHGDAGSVSLSTLASKHLDTHSSSQSIPALGAVQQTSLASLAKAHGVQLIPSLGSGQQTSLASLAEAHCAKSTSSAISGLSSLKPTSGASPQQLGLGTSLSNQMSALSIGKQDRPPSNVTTDGTGLGAGMSLSELASHRLSQEDDRATGMSALGTSLSHPIEQDSIYIAGASNFGASKNLTGSLSHESQRSQLKSSVPSLLSLSQMKLAEPSPLSHVPITAHGGVSKTDLSVKKAAPRLPPGFSIEGSKKTKLSAPPGFESRQSSDKKDGNMGRLLIVDTNSLENKLSLQPPPPSGKYVKNLFCKPSMFGKILTSVYIPPTSIHNQVKSSNPNLVESGQTRRQEQMMHRQFSYERQTSFGSRADDMLDGIVPFDFSTLSPDDIVRKRQSRAFMSGGGSKV